MLDQSLSITQDDSLLTTGGTHIVRHSGKEGPATSVLVPKDTRAMVTRWDNYLPMRGRPA